MKRNALFALLWVFLLLSACEREAIRRQQEEIRRQEAEIKKLRHEIDQENAAKKRQEQKTQNCAAAFRSFEKAQEAKEPRDAVALYRQGLDVCPDDDVAHYELGKILAAMGRFDEARAELDTALRINPNFQGARREMEKLGR
jgi:tetratricopeptide (TPR) repeat protein